MFYSRNIGLVTEEEQEKICKGSVLIAGVGGMGGVAAEVLVRMGVGKIKICDFDIYEETNLNRQIHSHLGTVGKYKVDVLREEFLKINPRLEIDSYKEEVTKENVDELLEGVGLIINGMDKMYSSLILERTARKKKLTIIDAWITPYASVFVMTPDSPHWEEFMKLPTLGVPIEELTEELCQAAVAKEVEYTFSHFNPYDIVDRDLVKGIVNGTRIRPSLAPVVWLSGVLMANEAVKVLTGAISTDYAGIFYNQYDHLLIKGNIEVTKKLKKIA